MLPDRGATSCHEEIGADCAIDSSSNGFNPVRCDAEIYRLAAPGRNRCRDCRVVRTENLVRPRRSTRIDQFIASSQDSDARFATDWNVSISAGGDHTDVAGCQYTPPNETDLPG